MCISVHITSLKVIFDFLFHIYLSICLTSITYLSTYHISIICLFIIYLSYFLSIPLPLSVSAPRTLSLLFLRQSISPKLTPLSFLRIPCTKLHETPFPAQTSYVFNFFHFFQCLLTNYRRTYFEKAYRTL